MNAKGNPAPRANAENRANSKVRQHQTIASAVDWESDRAAVRLPRQFSSTPAALARVLAAPARTREGLSMSGLSLAKPFAAASLVAEDEHTKPTPEESVIERRVAELSVLTEIKYAVARATAAKELGIRVGVLDKLSKLGGRRTTSARAAPSPSPSSSPGRSPLTARRCSTNSWRRYGGMSSSRTCRPMPSRLWIVFTHVHDAFDISPRLIVKSPQKRSGKTTLFSVLARLVARPRGASGITSSALLRLIELHGPTMLIDEMDALLGADKEMAQALRGLMNSGFNRSFAHFTMNVPTRDGGYEPREFSTWCPMALAGIGDVPETVRDRSIEIEMKRKLPSETVKKLRRRDGADLDELARKLKRWSDGQYRRAARRRTSYAGRAQRPCRRRLGAACRYRRPRGRRLAGARPSGRAGALRRRRGCGQNENIDTMLFSDIRDAFTSKGTDRLSGETLTAYLTGLEGRPWAEWKNGRPLTKFQLSRRLKKYGVASDALDLGGAEGRLKGYRREDFEDLSRAISLPLRFQLVNS